MSCSMHNKCHGKRFFEKFTVLGVETVNVSPIYLETTYDTSLPITDKVFNISSAGYWLTSASVSTLIERCNNGCFE